MLPTSPQPTIAPTLDPCLDAICAVDCGWNLNTNTAEENATCGWNWDVPVNSQNGSCRTGAITTSLEVRLGLCTDDSGTVRYPPTAAPSFEPTQFSTLAPSFPTVSPMLSTSMQPSSAPGLGSPTLSPSIFINIPADIGLPECFDTDFNESDSTDDKCPFYLLRPEFCGGFDDEDFNAREMCCGCNGGVQLNDVLELYRRISRVILILPALDPLNLAAIEEILLEISSIVDELDTFPVQITNSAGFHSLTPAGTLGQELIPTLLADLAHNVAKTFSAQPPTLTLSTPNIIFQAVRLDSLTSTEVELPIRSREIGSKSTSSATLPSPLSQPLLSNGMLTFPASYLQYQSAALFPASMIGTLPLNQIVMSIRYGNINNGTVSTFENNGRMQSNFNLGVNELNSSFDCSFWIAFNRSWEDSGCIEVVEAINDGIVSCSCSHLTSFGVLLSDAGSSDLSSADDTTLSVITYIGVAISMICILATLILYTIFPAARTFPKKVLMHLLTMLLATLILFLISSEAGLEGDNCKALAVILHYVFLATWGWMVTEAVVLYGKFVTVFDMSNHNRIRKFAAYAYGMPLLIVIPSYALGNQYYGSNRFCWIDSNFIWVVAGPVAACAVFNLGVLVQVLKSVQSLVTVSKTFEEYKSKAMMDMKLAAMGVGVLGVTFLLALIFLADINTSRWQYPFFIMNSLQGAFIVFSHVYMDPGLRKEINRCFQKKSPSPQTSNTSKHIDRDATKWRKEVISNSSGTSEKPISTDSGIVTNSSRSQSTSRNTWTATPDVVQEIDFEYEEEQEIYGAAKRLRSIALDSEC